MSYAPVTRKSSRAQAAAAAKATSRQPAPHRVVLRVKRTRSDPAVESLLVATEGEGFPARKRRCTVDNIEDSLLHMGLNNAIRVGDMQPTDTAPRLFFKRVRTTEFGNCRKQGEGSTMTDFLSLKKGTKGGSESNTSTGDVVPTTPTPCASGYLEIRRVKARGIAAGSKSMEGNPSPSRKEVADEYHVIDLQPVRRDEDGGDVQMGKGPKHGRETQKDQPTPLLNPLERQMDKAIFMAFQTGDMSCIRDLVASSPVLVNYQRRLGDGTTALMAASFHGDLDTVRYLLSAGAKVSVVDNVNKSATLLACMRGSRDCLAELQNRAKEEEARAVWKEGADKRDFVYDLYCFVPGNPEEQKADRMDVTATECSGDESRAEAVAAGCTTSDEVKAPVVHLSGIGPVEAGVVDGVNTELELQFEHDSDWSDLGNNEADEDPDSNSEGYYGNDYPDEDCEEALGEAHLPEGYSSSSEMGSSDEGQLSSDEDGYPRGYTKTRGFGRTCVDATGKPVHISGTRWPEERRLTSLRSPSFPGAECDDVLEKRDEVFVWDPARLGEARTVETDEESL